MADDVVQFEITVSDPKFFDALQNPQGFIPFLGEAMKNILNVYKEVASQYAPESEANQPGRFSIKTHEPMGYYERGRGWWYPVKTHNTLGLGKEIPTLKPHLKAPTTLSTKALLAVGVEGVAGYKLRATSQQMHDQWTVDVVQDANQVIGNLSNLASYSGYVQGVEQTKLHQARDWQTVSQSWATQQVQETVTTETMNAIDSYYNLSG